MPKTLCSFNSGWKKEKSNYVICLEENKLFLLNFISQCTLLAGWLTIRMNKFLFQLCESIERMPEGEGELCSIFWKHKNFVWLHFWHAWARQPGSSCIIHGIQPPLLVTICWVNDSYKHIVYQTFIKFIMSEFSGRFLSPYIIYKHAKSWGSINLRNRTINVLLMVLRLHHNI